MTKMINCVGCGSRDEFEIKDTTRLYSGEDYHFELPIKVPFCKKCGAPIYDEEVEAEIAKRANKIIREQRGIITREEILELLDKYNVSQKFLSKLLGWGEITLTRYISGNYTPSKTNSERLRSLINPYVFFMLLNNDSENSDRIKEDKKLYAKAYSRVCENLMDFERREGKIFKVVNWFLSQSSEEIPMTHLALQKLLYFTQSWSKALTGEWLFEDECQAWVHGAVYPNVYEVFKEFKYSPLPRVECMDSFSESEYCVLNAVKKYYFDVYSAKTLENICHGETPYIETRAGLSDAEKCSDVIKQKDIECYYKGIIQEYNITLENISNIKGYLNCILNKSR